MKKLACFLLLVLVAACGDGKGSSIAPVPEPVPDPVSFEDTPGPLAVGRKTDVLLYDGARDREVTATYWYPMEGDNAGPEQVSEGAELIAGDGQFPLLILVHGIEDNAPGTWPYLAPHLASHGYIVIAPSTGSTLVTAGDIVNHPEDISFLIDAALGVNSAENMFMDRILADKISLGGFSFGGLATFMTAYDSQFQDVRIKAAIIMAGLTNNSAPVNPDLTLFAIYGTQDPAVPYDVGLNMYEAASPPKYLLTLEGGGHLGFTRSDDRYDGATMDQSRQEALVRTAVFAFLTSLFADAEGVREAADRYLQAFDAENTDTYLYSQPASE
jgi:predicted dienelactone hydrolase